MGRCTSPYTANCRKKKEAYHDGLLWIVSSLKHFPLKALDTVGTFNIISEQTEVAKPLEMKETISVIPINCFYCSLFWHPIMTIYDNLCITSVSCRNHVINPNCLLWVHMGISLKERYITEEPIKLKIYCRIICVFRFFIEIQPLYCFRGKMCRKL